MAGKYNELLNEKVAVLTHQLLNHSRYHTEVHKCFRKLSCMKSFKPSILWPIIKDIREDTSINARPGKENDYVFKKVECFDEINELSVHNENGLDTVLEKICVIRLRRLVKQLMEQNLNLSSQADFSIKEADELKHSLMNLRREFDILSSELDREREKNMNLQYLAKELASIRQTQKVLLEELRDMQEERTALKCVNQKLLEELNNNVIDRK